MSTSLQLDVSAEPRFRVVSVFGPTLQGEGALAGTVSHFVRLAGCDYRCTWCDTPEAIYPKLYLQPGGSEYMTVPVIVDNLDYLGGVAAARWVTISGGNPLLYRSLGDLVAALHYEGYKVAVETQGSIYQEWAAIVDMLTISPKPPSAGQKPVDYDVIGKLVDRRAPHTTCFKMVVLDKEDLDFAVRVTSMVTFMTPCYVQPCDTHPMTEQSTPKPSFTAMRRRYASLVQAVLQHPVPIARRLIVIPQLHKLAEVK